MVWHWWRPWWLRFGRRKERLNAMATVTKLPASSHKTGADKVAGRKRLDPKEGDEGMIGQHLLSLVERAGMTPAEFAEKIGKDRDTVTLYFSGTRLPKLKEFRAIAQVLQLDNLRELLPDVPLRTRKRQK